MTPITAELLVDEHAVRLAVTTRDPATPEIEHRTDFAVEVCSSPVCHCSDMTLVRTATTAPDPKAPTEFLLDPFARTVVAVPPTGSAPGEPSGQAMAEAIPAEDWQRLRQAFFAAKARAFAAIDCSLERVEFQFEDVERWGTLVPLRDVVPYAPHLTLPAAGTIQFTVDEQYCVRPGCDCTESIIGLSAYSSADRSTSTIQAEPMVNFQIDWQHDRWRVAGESRQLTSAEEELRIQLLAANPGLLAELRHRHEIMCKLYEVSAAADRTARGSAPVRAARRIGRNEPCPCGSGKKYKRCCLLGGDAAAE